MKYTVLIVAVIGGLILGACGGGSEADGTVAGEEVTVQMFDNRYQYTEVRIPVGGSVNWLGAGRNPHNAVAVDGSWSTEDGFGSPQQLEGDSALLTYDRAGEYPFFCTFHGNADGQGMAGVLIVGESG